MKRMLIILGVVAVLLAGCLQKTVGEGDINEKVKPKDEKPEEVEEIPLKTFQADPSTFHFVADWLTDTKILFVEKDLGFYYVKTFDLESGVVETLHKDASIIVDVLIHPSKEHLLLHTTDNPSSAIIKILSIDGAIQNEISIESSELSIEWNDLDPSLVLLTAFHQDWTFDVFLYNANEESFGLIEIADPFPKWYGTEKVVSGFLDGHSLDGSTLTFYHPETEISERSELTNVVHFDTYGNSILIVRIEDTKDALYTIMDLDGSITSEWTMPAVSNYSEWVFPEIAWISGNAVFVPSPEEGGQLDDLIGAYQLTRIVEGLQDVLAMNVTASLLRCSPSGQRCLTGYAAEKLMDLKTREETIWIESTE